MAFHPWELKHELHLLLGIVTMGPTCDVAKSVNELLKRNFLLVLASSFVISGIGLPLRGMGQQWP